MRSQFLIPLLGTILFAGWYFYSETSPCIVPLPYSINNIDDRFGITADEVKAIMDEAETVWEKALARELFYPIDGAEFKINFIYDSRQAKIDTADRLKAELDREASVSESVRNEFKIMVDEYESFKAEYDREASQYQRDLSAHNDLVDKYNKAGGAPENVFADLKKAEESLDLQSAKLNTKSKQLSELANKINEVQATDNEIIEKYNAEVEKYNQTFTGGEQFTQGDYQGDSINIYHFKDKNELRNVLVHELGHAIGLDHVEGSESMMYYLMEDQPSTASLSEHDLEALKLVCAPSDNVLQKMHTLFSSFFIKLNLLN